MNTALYLLFCVFWLNVLLRWPDINSKSKSSIFYNFPVSLRALQKTRHRSIQSFFFFKCLSRRNWLKLQEVAVRTGCQEMTENLNTELQQQLRVSCSEVAAQREPSDDVKSWELRADAHTTGGGYSEPWESRGAQGKSWIQRNLSGS